MTRTETTRFTVEEAQAAADDWGLNCGPGAAAAVLGLTPDEIRPHLGDFERKGYANPTLMRSILKSVGAKFSCRGGGFGRTDWPLYGLAVVQWEGPWTKLGVPARVAYRHTHWVGARCKIVSDHKAVEVFDINCMSVGGWVSLLEWETQVVPWLLKECHPKASGQWHLTHAVEVQL